MNILKEIDENIHKYSFDQLVQIM